MLHLPVFTSTWSLRHNEGQGTTTCRATMVANIDIAPSLVSPRTDPYYHVTSSFAEPVRLTSYILKFVCCPWQHCRREENTQTERISQSSKTVTSDF